MRLLLILAIVPLIFLGSCAKKKNNSKPNVILILADDLGYGDVSSFNIQSKINTPNIDQLAATGICFTDAHASSSVCSPSRYSLLTGRYAWRTRLQSGVLGGYSPALIADSIHTLADLFLGQGYHTACIGKWHLGMDWAMSDDSKPSDKLDESGFKIDFSKPVENGPLSCGFEYFYGISASLDIPPYVYIENTRATTIPVDTIQAKFGKEFYRRGIIADNFQHAQTLEHLTKKATRYISEHSQQPFFLYFPLTAPHTPIMPSPEFVGKSGIGPYGDFVCMVDWVVGRIAKELKQRGIYDNTLIIFTSDNGCSGSAGFDEMETYKHHPSSNFRGKKTDLFEGGHRVPLVVKLPGCNHNLVSNQPVSLTGIKATLSAYLNFPVDSCVRYDGQSFSSALKGINGSEELPIVFHSVEGKFGLKYKEWEFLLDPGSGGLSEPSTSKAIALGLPMEQLYLTGNDSAEWKNLEAQNSTLTDSLRLILTKEVSRIKNDVSVVVNKAEIQKKEIEKSISKITHLGQKAILQANSDISRPALSGVAALNDGICGSNQFSDGYWTGQEGKNLEIEYNFENPIFVTKAAFSLLENQSSWIFLPDSIVVLWNNDSQIKHRKIAVPAPKPSGQISRKLIDIKMNESIKNLKFIFYNHGICPPWHSGNGQPCWMFIDEIIVD